MQKEKLEIRDIRHKKLFVIDDQFLNGYARFVGIYAVGVYNSLCRHADKDQNCWPSIKKIGEELDIDRKSVINAIKYLEFWNIIKKERIGKQCNNRYYLLDKKEWKIISEVPLKDFSEVRHKDFSSVWEGLHKSLTGTSIVRKHNSKETHIKEGKKNFNCRNCQDKMYIENSNNSMVACPKCNNVDN